MDRRNLFALGTCILLLTLAACALKSEDLNQRELQWKEVSTVSSGETDITSMSESELSVPQALKLESEDSEKLAEHLLKSAFSFEAKESSPMITHENNLVSFRYSKSEDDPSDFFVVDFFGEYDYPLTLYHFCHPNKERVSIEKNEDFQFDTKMVETAKSFVEEVYGVDCSQADAYAYGYANKISVQLNVAENIIFQVRFYYKEDKPVGILFFTDQTDAKAAMEANNATCLYPNVTC